MGTKGRDIYWAGYPPGAFFPGSAVFFVPLKFLAYFFAPLKFLVIFFVPLNFHTTFDPPYASTKIIFAPLKHPTF